MPSPIKGQIIGCTHDANGDPIIRVPRSLKVSIGIPAGPDVHVFMDNHTEKPWVMTVNKKDYRYATKKECKAAYAAALKAAREDKKSAPGNRAYPSRLEYFTFRSIGTDGALYPDFDAIEACGPRPRRIGIVFAEDAPLQTGLELWGAGHRKCVGDGVNASRSVDWPLEDRYKKIAAEAKANGEKYFPILGGCRLGGCPFADDKSCKPHTRLGFQLVNRLSLGGQAEIDTTSWTSTRALMSSVSTLDILIRNMGLSLNGMPCELVTFPFNVKGPDGKVKKQTGLKVELHADSLAGLRNRLIAAVGDFRTVPNQKAIAAAPPAEVPPAKVMIDGQEVEVIVMDDDEETAFTQEFAPETEADGDPEDADGSAEDTPPTETTPQSQADKAAERTAALVAGAKPETKPAAAAPPKKEEPKAEPAAQTGDFNLWE